jgi:hypothetical protein
MGIKVTNNAVSAVPLAIVSTDTSLDVTAGEGVVFPILGVGDYFYATITSTANVYEVVKCTARVDDTLTIERAQEDTIAVDFPANSRISIRVTVQNIISLFQDVDFILL